MTAPGGFDLVDVDPAAVAIAYLLGRSRLVEAFGDGGWLTSRNEPPYPHVKITDTPGGADRALRWLIAPELTIETHGDVDGSPGKAALRRLHLLVLQELRDLPDQPAQPGQPVVTAVGFPGAHGWVPEPTGQPRYLSRVHLAMHPPQPLPQP